MYKWLVVVLNDPLFLFIWKGDWQGRTPQSARHFTIIEFDVCFHRYWRTFSLFFLLFISSTLYLGRVGEGFSVPSSSKRRVLDHSNTRCPLKIFESQFKYSLLSGRNLRSLQTGKYDTNIIKCTCIVPALFKKKCLGYLQQSNALHRCKIILAYFLD